MHYETAFILAIVVALSVIHSSDALMCTCTCCKDNSCTRIARNNNTALTCDACGSICETKFSSKCKSISGHVSHECTSDNLLSRLAATPNWIGEFRITGDDCDTESCCCLTDVVYFTRGANNNLRVQGQFTGECPVASPILDATYPMPSESFTDLRFLNQLVTVQLIEESRKMLFQETDNIACRYQAVRENAASLNTINWICVLLLLSSLVGVNKLFI